MSIEHTAVLVVGAGPAGLTAAFETQKAGIQTLVIEKDPRYVGGISRTVEYRGYRFDIGGHRFFSKSNEVTQWWKERLPDDFISVRRMSRIFYRRKYFDYPLKPWNALSGLGFFTSVACVCSYAWSRLFPIKPEKSFEDWVTNRFGRRLFSIFFKTYTEKVWGIPTSELSADWAAQRIKGLSLSKAIINAFRGKQKGKSAAVIKTLIDTFEYPRLGPGQMWEKTADDLQRMGGRLEMGARVTRLHHRDGEIVAAEIVSNGASRRVTADQFIVSMPLQETVLAFDPPLPENILAAARKLAYRDFLTVALVVEGENPFPDNWIYIHDPAVKLGRIQNFKNWSEALIGREGTTCLGLEYFCFEGDGLWTMKDADLIELGKRELVQLGLAKAEQVKDGAVVRIEKAYPVYDPGYQERVQTIRRALQAYAKNLQVVGRNGMHKYNNQDHSMMTALLAAKNLQGGRFNLWNVNSDAEYHEEERATDRTGRVMPERVS
ncbi:MAG TPA: NAD(P)/FAD-dependent oxidoreductase [Opitutaceae bacterium]|nr:NAD(P)/FAD-dependent oxidoreductase [Opitutaceae bacterium]